MNFSFVELVLPGVFNASANVPGGLILFPTGIHNRFKPFLKYILALGAGFMLAVTLIDIFPETIAPGQSKGDGDSPEFLCIR